MKSKISRILGVVLTVVMVASLFVFAAPASATIPPADTGTIIINKVTTPPGATEQFKFFLDGTPVGTIGDGGQIVIHNVPVATHTLTETLPPKWVLVNVAYDDANSYDGYVIVDPCETVTATFYNSLSAITVDIIECPGCANCGEPPYNVPVGTTFVVKAEITNTSSYPIGGRQGLHWTQPVKATIHYSGNVQLLTEYPDATVFLGRLDPGEMDTVAWTFRCTGEGDVPISIDTNYGQNASDTCIVHQVVQPGLDVVVTAPCEVTPFCQWKAGTVDATITNTGDIDLTNVNVTLTKSGTGTVTPATFSARTIALLPARGHVHISGLPGGAWAFQATGEGDVLWTVSAQGTNSCTGELVPLSGFATGTKTTQIRGFLVDVTCVSGLSTDANCQDCLTAPDGTVYGVVSTLQKFEITTVIDNGFTAKANSLTIHLQLPTDATLDTGTLVHVVPSSGSPSDVAAVSEGNNLWKITYTNLCSCCNLTVTWTAKCTSSSLGVTEPITVSVDSITLQSGTPAYPTYLNTPCNPAGIIQELKVHLASILNAYVRDCTGCPVEVNTVAVGQDFNARLVLTNTGEAAAYDVVANFVVTGPSTCAGTYNNVDIGYIPGHGSKSIWLSDVVGHWCNCTGEGVVLVNVTGLTGYDENTCEPILTENIEEICPLQIQQCPITVEIINPVNGENICSGDVFAVKARITDCGCCDYTFNQVKAMLSWEGDGDVVVDSDDYDNPFALGEVKSICEECTTYEVSWMVRCTKPGDVTFHVCVDSLGDTAEGARHFQIRDITNPPATVHQRPRPDITVEITSPDNLDTFVGTSQEFAVTAVIANNTSYHHGGPWSAESYPVTITDLGLVLYPETGGTILAGPDFPFPIQGGESKTVTWTVRCDDTGLQFIDAYAFAATYECCPTFEAHSVPLLVWQYPVAHLDANILSVSPSTTISSGSNFDVNFRVTNTGEADATEVKAILSVSPEGSARPAEGENGFTINIGTLPGHDAENNFYEGTFLMYCKEVSNSTITISATGFDEYGWHKKQECQSTGNFIVEAGGFYTLQLNVPEEDDFVKGAQVGLFVGESSGLIGPFNFDTPISWVDFNGGDNTGKMVGMGVVIPDMDFTKARNQVEFLLHILPAHGPNLLDLLEKLNLQGVNKDVMIYVGHITMDPENVDLPLDPENVDLPSDWCNVTGGLIQLINGHFTGTSLELTRDGDNGVFSWLNGTYCSTMAKEALRAIDAKFIEPASVTVKQLPSGGLDLGISKTVSDFAPEVGEDVTYTIIVTNYGPNVATGVKVTDYVWPTPSYTITQGTYNASTGIWSVGNMAVGTLATMMVTVDVASPAASTNTATVTCDQPDGVPFNNAASVTINGFPIVKANSFTLALNEGWNFISWPLIPTDSTPTPAELLAELISPDLFGIVWGNYNATSGYWQSYAPPPTGGDLTSMRDGIGFWIWMDSAATLTVSGTELPPPPNTPPTYNVLGGRWNVIGFKSPTAKIPANYLGGIANKYTVIYGYKDGMYFLVGTPANPFLEPGLAYWIAVQQDGIIYP